MKVFIYPGDGIRGGTIEERMVKEVLEHKVVYFKEDRHGYIGCKKTGVYFTRQQAEFAKLHDRSMSQVKFFLIERLGFTDGRQHLTYVMYGPYGDDLVAVASEHHDFWQPIAPVMEFKMYHTAFFASIEYHKKDFASRPDVEIPEALEL